MPRINFMMDTKKIEKSAMSQIKTFLDTFNPSEFPYTAIMADVHAGKGCVIGFTSKLKSVVVPSLIGVDIGCGVMTVPIKKDIIGEIDFEAFDEYIKKTIPMGFNHRAHDSLDHKYLPNDPAMVNTPPYAAFTSNDFSHAVKTQIGTLGGGNHFIEVEESDTHYYLTVHTGSRNLGYKIAQHYINCAKNIMGIFKNDLGDLSFLPIHTDELGLLSDKGIYSYGAHYIDDMELAQRFAHYNRKVILSLLLEFFNNEFTLYDFEYIESIHNYINRGDSIIRKGAISAYTDEDVIIPLNMADGVIIGTGKSSSKWNYSAPHGAGRVMSRKQAHNTLDMDLFKEKMNDIYSSTVCEETLDESPMAYKKSEDIIEAIKETVEIKEILKPVYNIKAVN